MPGVQVKRWSGWFASYACALLTCVTASALDRDLTLDQFNHRRWTLRDNAPPGVIALAQTSEGRLWLGTSAGLFWTDGISFEPHAPSRQFPLPSTNISAMRATADDSIWLGFELGGVSRIQQQYLTSFDSDDGLPQGAVHALDQDRSGALWAASDGGLARFSEERWQLVDESSGMPAGAVLSVFVDRQGTVWAATADVVMRLPAGEAKFRRVLELPSHVTAIGSFAQAPDGSVWLSGSELGIVRVDEAGNASRRHAFNDRVIGQIVFDRDGNLWMAGQSLGRLGVALDASDIDRRLEELTRAGGLSGSLTHAILEDREGNIWVGTSAGLDRFAMNGLVPVPLPWAPGRATLVAGSDGSVWIGGGNAASVLRFANGKLVEQRSTPAFTAGTRGRDGDVWFGGPRAIARVNPQRLELTPLPEPMRDHDVQAMVQDASGALWVSVQEHGVFRFSGGQWTANGGIAGLSRETALSATVDAKGDLWFGYTDNKLARVSAGRVQMFTAADGLEVGAVTALHAQDSLLWVGGELGLMVFDGARFVTLRPQTCQPFRSLSGMVTSGNDLWIFRGAGLTRIENVREQLASLNAEGRVSCGTFGRIEGLPGSAQQLRSAPSLIQSDDGRLWVAATDGVAWVDPRAVERRRQPPAATILVVSTDRDRHAVEDGPIRLPVHTQDVHIDYTAWSLTVPEQVRFRYWLEGLDQSWRIVGRQRSATFTNLGPGTYRFRVAASHDNEHWSPVEAAVRFEILPAFYQTEWFKVLCVLTALLLLTLMSWLQMRRATSRLRARLEERMLERERIARELHDTLLQGLQGLIMRFHSVALRIPEQEPLRDLMERALQRADQVLIESRDKVTDLRDVSGSASELSQDIAEAGQELRSESPIEFSVTMHGTPRTLHLIVREEAFLITREALANAFTHAGAARVEAEVWYERNGLRICIRDDGRGLDEQTLKAGGRSGHWGLIGMRERAQKIGATLQIYSRANAGTEIDLRVPSAMAYSDRRVSRRRHVESN